jgi:hypothetical protein
MNDYSNYNYFKGEDENPFDAQKQADARMFWEYEELFENRYIRALFTPADYDFLPDGNEWRTAVEAGNKEAMFQYWMCQTLDNIADKTETPFSEINSRYWGR